MAKVMFGYEYKMYGVIEVEVPDHLDEKGIIEHLNANISEYPLPEDSDYVEDSCIVDEESIRIL